MDEGTLWKRVRSGFGGVKGRREMVKDRVDWDSEG